MKFVTHPLVRLGVAIFAIFSQTIVLAADVSTATLTLSGNVPEIFSLTIRGVPGDLDLSPGVLVNDRLLGVLHFKYNINILTLNMTTDTASGKPENASGAYNFGAAGFKVKFSACTTIAAANQALFAPTQAAQEISSATAKALTDGIDEECDLTASWQGTSGSIPLAGKYSVTFTFVMTST